MTLHLNKWGRITAIALFSVAMTLAFQNCGDPEFGMEADLASEGTLSAEVENAPFAYDTTVNQLTYMSCTKSGTTNSVSSSAQFLNNNSDAFFTFRASSYSGAGIKLNDQFISYANTELKNIKTGKWDDAKVLSALTEAPANLGSQIQLAIRKANNWLNPLAYSGVGSGFGYDHTLMFFKLDIPEVASQLMSTSFIRMDEFLGAQVPERFIDGKLYFQQSNEAGAYIRNALSSDHMLTLTYAEDVEASKSTPRLDAASGTNLVPRVFGRGFKFNWTQGPLAAGSGGAPIKAQPDAIGSITEYDLSTLQANGSWACKQLLVIEPREIQKNPSACVAKYTYSGTDTSLGLSKQDVFNRMIRHLPVDSWQINLDTNCAVPLKGDCYYSAELESKSTQSQVVVSDVDYTGTLDCGVEPNGMLRPKECARHISVCFRTN